MPVMDGKQAAAAIRKYEELLDPRLALNARRVDNRIPIIAVSATLLESQKVELGIDFDGWMLKPIDFKRMLQILVGISEPDKRKEDAYERGKWERGGWLNGELRDTAYSFNSYIFFAV
jgi:CheY-like chemotaxis protein